MGRDLSTESCKRSAGARDGVILAEVRKISDKIRGFILAEVSKVSKAVCEVVLGGMSGYEELTGRLLCENAELRVRLAECRDTIERVGASNSRAALGTVIRVYASIAAVRSAQAAGNEPAVSRERARSAGMNAERSDVPS